MEVGQEHKGQIEHIMEAIDCPKGFECHRSGFRKLGSVRLIAGGRVLECLEENALTCRFGLSYGDGVFCECPLRDYIAKSCCTLKANQDLQGSF